MNPFTQALLKQLDDRQLQQFVINWDKLEAEIIRIYKSGQAAPEEEAGFQKTRRWLESHYPQWKVALNRYWPAVRAGGELLIGDPFESLLAISGSEQIPGNWRAMQLLPAAREALNQFLIDQIEK